MTTPGDQPGSAARGRLRLERVGLARATALVTGAPDALAVGDPAGRLVAGPGWPHPDTMDGLRFSAEHATADEDTGFLVVLADTDQVIGDAGWKGGPDRTGTVEIGYGLAGPFRGRGLGTELVGLISAWALAQPGVRRVIACVLPGNEPSWRALLRAGFVLAPSGPGAQPDPSQGRIWVLEPGQTGGPNLVPVASPTVVTPQ